jgi:hypothetical protein
MRRAALCPRFRAALLPACNRHSVAASMQSLEAEHDSRRHSQIILRLRVPGGEFVEASQQVIHLCRTKRKARVDAIVDATPYGHCKRVLIIPRIELPSGVRNAEQHFPKRRNTPEVMIGNARAKKVCGKRTLHSGAKNIAGMITAEIGDAA